MFRRNDDHGYNSLIFIDENKISIVNFNTAVGVISRNTSPKNGWEFWIVIKIEIYAYLSFRQEQNSN